MRTDQGSECVAWAVEAGADQVKIKEVFKPLTWQLCVHVHACVYMCVRLCYHTETGNLWTLCQLKSIKEYKKNRSVSTQVSQTHTEPLDSQQQEQQGPILLQWVKSVRKFYFSYTIVYHPARWEAALASSYDIRESEIQQVYFTLRFLTLGIFLVGTMKFGGGNPNQDKATFILLW